MTHSPSSSQPDSGPLIFGRNNALFAWLHLPAAPADLPAVVICNPVGFEYIRAYRSLRVLAERLANSGHVVVRFDYPTTGDSAGSETDEARIAAMLDGISEAIDVARRHAATERVSLIGLRLGATLAAKVAEATSLEQLVLWAPCDSGAIYAREQQIMAAAQKKRLEKMGEPVATVDGIDAGGFLISAETQAELATLTLGSEGLAGAPDVLLLNRDDMRVPPAFANALKPRCRTLTVADTIGFKEMMLPPQLATVPGETIADIVAWFNQHTATAAGQRPPESPQRERSDILDTGDGVIERPLRFGPDARLFGILTMQPGTTDQDRPALILLCGGATHRVSANRMYVTLARRLAASGTPVLRFDLGGIGDSLAPDGAPTGKPYTAALTNEIDAAMAAITEITEQRRFILFGLCSGAYAAMQTAMRSDRVAGIVLANQLVYNLTDADLQGLASGSIPSAHDLDFPRSSGFMYRLAVKALRRVAPLFAAPGQWLAPWLLGGSVRRDFESLLAKDVDVAILLSSRDDAVDALTISCGKWLRQQRDSGRITVDSFRGTDHTFSPTASQIELSDWFADYLARRQ